MTNDRRRPPAHDAAAWPSMGGLAGRVGWDSPLTTRPIKEGDPVDDYEGSLVKMASS